jgi:hypothetical protein
MDLYESSAFFAEDDQTVKSGDDPDPDDIEKMEGYKQSDG